MMAGGCPREQRLSSLLLLRLTLLTLLTTEVVEDIMDGWRRCAKETRAMLSGNVH
jgi:hypothetical protein